MQRVLISVLCLLLLATATHAQKKKYSFSKQKMGSPFNIIIVSIDSAKAADLAARCYQLVDSFNSVFSDYDPQSELSLLNAAAGKGKQPVSPAMKELLLLSIRAYKKSDHAFDVSIGPLSQLWRRSRKAKQFPSAAEVSAMIKHTGLSKLILNSSSGYVTLPDSAMRLDFGGIAKGYIAQKVIDLLQDNGITQALADAGGDMVMSKAANNTNGWTVGINIPETTDQLLPRYLLLQNKAVATSGDAYQYIEHGGKKYSHIIDPRIGYGVQSQRNVTVIANNGSDADWLATACSILPIEQAKQVAIKCDAELLITEMRDGKVVYHMTKGFAKYWRK